MLERERALRDCRDTSRTTCDIAAIRAIPASFFVLDIAPAARDWVNVAYARYFGLSEGFFLGLQMDYDLMQRRREIDRDPKAIRPRAA